MTRRFAELHVALETEGYACTVVDGTPIGLDMQTLVFSDEDASGMVRNLAAAVVDDQGHFDNFTLLQLRIDCGAVLSGDARAVSAANVNAFVGHMQIEDDGLVFCHNWPFPNGAEMPSTLVCEWVQAVLFSAGLVLAAIRPKR